jgi:caffeoyl-CoA O-methyltransferase
VDRRALGDVRCHSEAKEAQAMFHDIPGEVLERMRYLEEMDARHRREKLDQFDRLRQIPPETGRFLALLASGAPGGSWIEIGASGGYSALWIALAARARGARLTTFEISDKKAKIALETIRTARVEDAVELVRGDARDHLGGRAGVAFCFLDAEKEYYSDCYEAVIPNMVAGGILAADNVISHQEVLRPWSDKVLSDPRVDALIVPVGLGILMARRT